MEYKIKKVRVYPKEPIEWNNGVYLGVSMNNSAFRSVETCIEIITKISENVDHFYVLVGDSLHRFNEKIYAGYTEDEALIKCLAKGEELMKLIEQAAKLAPKSSAYSFIKTSDLRGDLNLLEKKLRLNELYDSHNEFKRLIDQIILIFLRRQPAIKVDKNQAVLLCKEYLIEELAIFELLAGKGLNVNVYPGNQLPVIKEIVSGNLKGVSGSLEQIQAVEFKLRPL